MHASSCLPPGVRNIVLDLGGVVLNIDHRRTADAFARHGVQNFAQRVSLGVQEPIFDHLETGELDSAGFRSKLCAQLALTISDPEFDEAWNALLLDIPRERFDLIVSLRKKYRVFLLSNTNLIHIESVHSYLRRSFAVTSLHQMFDKAYLSYELGMRKPHVEIYRHVLEDSGLAASETVFLDDALPNLEGAKKAGMHVIHVTPERDIIACLRGA